MKYTFFNSVSKFLQKDISLSLTLSYVALVAIGIIFNSAYYLFFRINIIQYSDISDFLLAPFRDPFILIFTIGTIVFLHYNNIFDNWLEENHPKIHQSFYMGLDKEKFQQWYASKGMVLAIISYTCLVSGFYGIFQFNKVKKGKRDYTHVIMKDNKFEPTDTLYFIGKNNGFVFLYNKNKQQTNAIPMSDVLRIEVDKK